jgi:hypothetical protein
LRGKPKKEAATMTMRRIYTEVFPPEVIEEVLAEGDTLEF